MALKISILQMYLIRMMGNNQYVSIKLSGNGKNEYIGQD